MATKMDIAKLDLVDESHAGQSGVQKVAVLEEIGKIGIRHAQIPEPGQGEIRVKIRHVGICGSDLESYRGCRSPEFLSTPVRLGHEVSGVIDRLGEGVRGLKVGQRVTCRYVWGAFAEYIVCQPFNVHTVPEHLDDRDISPIEVMPGIIHAAELDKITTNTDVLIMGQGVSGLVMTQVVSMFSPRNLVVTDLKERNLELARRYGATHTVKLDHAEQSTMEKMPANFADGFEVVIPCLLEGDGMIDAVDCASMGGRIVMYGCIGTCNQPFDWLKVHRRRLTIHATEPRRDVDMRRFYTEAVGWVEQGLVNLSEMIIHHYSFEEIAEAFAKRDEALGDAIHILVECGS